MRLISLCAQHVNYKHVSIDSTPTHVSLLLTSLLMDPSSSKCRTSFDCCLFFMGCCHVTALLILIMSAYIFPASCLHFRTSLWSITANRWVHLQYSPYTDMTFCRSSWIQSDFVTHDVLVSFSSDESMCVQQNVRPVRESPAFSCVSYVCTNQCDDLPVWLFSNLCDVFVAFVLGFWGMCRFGCCVSVGDSNSN